MEAIKCFVKKKGVILNIGALKGSGLDLPVHILFDRAEACNVSWIAWFLTGLHLSKYSLDMDAPELVSQASKTDNIFKAEGFGAAQRQNTQRWRVRKYANSPMLNLRFLCLFLPGIQCLYGHKRFWILGEG